VAIRRWSVQLAVECRVDNALIDALTNLAHTMRWHGMAFRPASGDEPETVTIEFEALDGKEARIRAQHMLDRAQAIARSTPRGSHVRWVAPLKETEESSLRFLGRARDLLEEEDYALSVVAAQIHLETQIATLMRLVGEKSDRGWAPHDRSGRRLLETLLDVKMSEFSAWSEYRTHVRRRNDVTHGGASVDRESAERSLQVVSDLWLWLNEAALRVSTDRAVQSA
jgi:hypothetical protein